MDDVIDVVSHEVDESQAMERYEPKHPATLFGTDDPVAVISKASAVASALADIIEKQKLYSLISGKKHVRVEGWTLLGTMLGIFPVVEYCIPVEIDGVKGFEAKVNAKTRDGEIVGSAISYCMRNEQRWAKAEAYACSSMSQTRAISKALRGPLGFVVTMAGYDATPMEELPPPERPQPPPPRRFDPGSMLRADAPTARQGWKGVMKMLDAIDPSIEWSPIIEQAIKGFFGKDFELKGAEEEKKAEAFCRTANAAGRLTELFTTETFLSHEAIQRAFAEMFNGIVVNAKEFEKAEPAPLSSLNSEGDKDGT